MTESKTSLAISILFFTLASFFSSPIFAQLKNGYEISAAHLEDSTVLQVRGLIVGLRSDDLEVIKEGSVGISLGQDYLGFEGRAAFLPIQLGKTEKISRGELHSNFAITNATLSQKFFFIPITTEVGYQRIQKTLEENLENQLAIDTKSGYIEVAPVAMGELQFSHTKASFHQGVESMAAHLSAGLGLTAGHFLGNAERLRNYLTPHIGMKVSTSYSNTDIGTVSFSASAKALLSANQSNLDGETVRFEGSFNPPSNRRRLRTTFFTRWTPIHNRTWNDLQFKETGFGLGIRLTH